MGVGGVEGCGQISPTTMLSLSALHLHSFAAATVSLLLPRPFLYPSRVAPPDSSIVARLPMPRLCLLWDGSIASPFRLSLMVALAATVASVLPAAPAAETRRPVAAAAPPITLSSLGTYVIPIIYSFNILYIGASYLSHMLFDSRPTFHFPPLTSLIVNVHLMFTFRLCSSLCYIYG